MYVRDVQLTRSRIIATVIELIETDGVEAVSMHRLATELGCSVMSLYNHVPSKSALLDRIADQVMSAVEVTPMPQAGCAEWLQAQVRAFRKIARTHPRCAMVALSRRPTSASRVRPAETALATLLEAGFKGQEAVRILRTFLAYIMGSLMLEVANAPGLADAEDVAGAKPWNAELEGRDPEADFEFGLDLLAQAVAAAARRADAV